MKKSVLIVCTILFFTLFLVSCQERVQGGDSPQDTASIARSVSTGTQGLEISLVTNYPPATIWDQTELLALVDIKNKGNYDLEPQDCFLRVTGQDETIIGGDFSVVRSCAENLGGPLEGKSLYNTQGGENQLEFTSTGLNLPQGAFEYDPTLNFKACYVYHTTASPLVCIDPQLFQITADQKTCIPRPADVGGGQGGPVGVSYVGVEMIANKAHFDITITNFGGGIAMNPNADLQGCDDGGLARSDLDKIRFSVQMTSGSVQCNPRDGFVRLVNNVGKIRCTAEIPGSTTFETPLTIDLDYGYQNSVKKQIRIVKTPE
jgi:hypothetical protein